MRRLAVGLPCEIHTDGPSQWWLWERSFASGSRMVVQWRKSACMRGSCRYNQITQSLTAGVYFAFLDRSPPRKIIVLSFGSHSTHSTPLISQEAFT
ncbi:hypothetical protein BV25DRAFT_1373115 [Artomyces pyxidatus]|uniref:Uncharacterized protein n=1 Tax=Artomyces pyxidatus TaxID=48021 RepID=A0ACB8TD15_9AGAM|nr:hypothetical protein BV25DRAFT_1373115 [Artomyces pyxidatus]